MSTKPQAAIVIQQSLAEQHAQHLVALYSMNKQGMAVGGLALEGVLDVIRSLRGQKTWAALFEEAWRAYPDRQGELLDFWMQQLGPDGQPIRAADVTV